jgi:hydrogenase maturation protease
MRKVSTLILGVGNPILSDDGVGIRIARKLKEESPQSEVVETSEVGMALLDVAAGFDKLIIIDSIKTGQGKPGEVYKLGLEDLKPSIDFPSSHGLDIATAFELGRKLGYVMPRHISLYAVEVRDNITFGEGCSEEIEERVPFITKHIIDEEKI